MNTLVPLGREEFVEVVPFTPQERLQERIVEQSVNVPVPRNKKEIAEVLQRSPQECVQERIAKQDVHITLPPAKEELAEVVRITPNERGNGCLFAFDAKGNCEGASAMKWSRRKCSMVLYLTSKRNRGGASGFSRSTFKNLS